MCVLCHDHIIKDFKTVDDGWLQWLVLYSVDQVKYGKRALKFDPVIYDFTK